MHADIRRQKILVIGMADSVHLARWLSQFSALPIDFELFPSSPHRRIHPTISKLIQSTGQEMSVSIRPLTMRWMAFPLSALDLIFQNRLRARLLRRVILKGRFDVVHALELQHAAYLLLATNLRTELPTVFVTNWGSDIFWYQRFPRHHSKILTILQMADIYSAECQRDVEIVRQLGFTGVVQPVIPNSGGINLDELDQQLKPPSERRRIMVKGYTGFVGQALTALKACEIAAPYLRGYEITLYSASIKARLAAMRLRLRHGLRFTVLMKRTPHAEMLRYFSESRVYLGVSLSDGISTSLLESMATGCYPIQTRTSCANEWVRGNSGSLVAHDDVHQIAEELIAALLDDTKVDEAGRVNRSIIQERASTSKVASIATAFYSPQ